MKSRGIQGTTRVVMVLEGMGGQRGENEPLKGTLGGLLGIPKKSTTLKTNGTLKKRQKLPRQKWECTVKD